MKQDEGVLDRAIWGLVHSAPGGFVLALVLLLYPGLGLILPLALGLPGFYVAVLNLVCVVFAAVIGLAWTGSLFEAVHRRTLLDWTTNLRNLDSREFEWLVGELFRREGWSVRETGSPDSADGNIDLRLSRDGREVLVQCKRWQSYFVQVSDIREFLGTLARERLPTDAGIFVTLSRFTEQARQESAQAGLSLIDGAELHGRIERVRSTEPCPQCGAQMILAKSQFGWWLRCPTEGCGGKRDLSREPAAAVELLMR